MKSISYYYNLNNKVVYHYFIIKNLLELAAFNRALKRTTDAAVTIAVGNEFQASILRQATQNCLTLLLFSAVYNYFL